MYAYTSQCPNPELRQLPKQKMGSPPLICPLFPTAATQWLVTPSGVGPKGGPDDARYRAPTDRQSTTPVSDASHSTGAARDSITGAAGAKSPQCGGRCSGNAWSQGTAWTREVLEVPQRSIPSPDPKP